MKIANQKKIYICTLHATKVSGGKTKKYASYCMGTRMSPCSRLLKVRADARFST